MSKKPILSKLNKKDYNNLLEQVLEDKDFTANTKNLLLSMLYKVETSYKDYKKVKVFVKDRDEVIEEIINTIKDRCDQIALVEPKSEKGKQLGKNKKIATTNGGDITAYPTEKALITAIAERTYKNFYIKPEYRIIRNQLKEILEMGYNSNIKETVFNFDGWAWNNQFEDEKELLYNIIFFNIVTVLGLEFIEEWKNSKEDLENFIDKAQVKVMLTYGKKDLNRLLNAIYRVLLKILVKENEEDVLELLEEGEKIKEALDYLENKPKYLEDIYSKKKHINEQIRVIDNMLLDKRNLLEEYERRNKSLSLESQIFSMRHLAEILKKEREILFNEIKNYNIRLDPNTYLAEKQELVEKYRKFGDVKKAYNSKNTLIQNIVFLQKIFLNNLSQRVANATTKKELIDLIYIFRYYKFLKVSESEYLKNVEEMQKALNIFEDMLLDKSYDNNIFIKFTADKNQNINIIKGILDTKIIDMENIIIVFKSEGKKELLEIYDGEVLDNTLEVLNIEQKINLRRGKKNKLFV